jgi:hypothetical protein
VPRRLPVERNRWRGGRKTTGGLVMTIQDFLTLALGIGIVIFSIGISLTIMLVIVKKISDWFGLFSRF